MNPLRRTGTALAVAVSLSLATPGLAFAQAADEVSVPSLSPDLFLASADTGERAGGAAGLAGLSHLEMKTSAPAGAAVSGGPDAWLLWGVMFGSVFVANSLLAYDGYVEAETNKIANSWLPGVLNFFLGGAGYIYNGKRIPLGIGLTLGALGLTYVEMQLLDKAQASGK